MLTAAFSLSQGVLGVWLGVMNVMIEMNVNLNPLNLNQVLKYDSPVRFALFYQSLIYVGAKRLARFLGNCRKLRPRLSDSQTD